MVVCISLLVSLASLTATDASHPSVTNPPKWSWDTLGSMAFCHSGQAQGYNASDLQLLKKFSMVQFDKKQGISPMPNDAQEDRFIAAARQVKAVNKDTQVLMYINALMNFPNSRLHNLTSPELLLRNNQSEQVKIRGLTVFDLKQPAMRKIFVDDALYGMASGAFNGVFIDRANWASSGRCHGSATWDAPTCKAMIPAQRQLFVELTAALGEGNITLSKETSATKMIDWQVANAAMTSDTFCSHYCHGCNDSVTPASTWTHPKDAQDCADSIATIANMSASGQLTQSHAMGPFDGPASAEARAFTMAAFLIGAGNLSFFSYANWATNCWELAGTAWWPEYDYPLGHPTSPPNTKVPGKRWKYSRTFSSGTTVYVDVATRVVEIKWATSNDDLIV